MGTILQKNYADRSWAVQIKKDDFFMDIWMWYAMPFVADGTLGDFEFCGIGCCSEESAKHIAQAELMKRGIKEAVLLSTDDIKEAS